ncbi:flagellar biosynthesis regulator FlaF [Stappia sp. F7233]|uniref:Flagellar biosynthesis regulator FlaF n=1 Tax=Stappia albiluteola TaxID=2758565 RepID=A0A839AHP6_9HYPH|nr:flagellar biosynthesis regulator FlaF [Stappia albiluteola]MBA5778454.1 flagellar biosynthesis regulator FlaF [Stappia albiluteola]
MHNLAASAYQTTSQKTVGGRELEAQLLLKAAAKLQLTLEQWETEAPESLSDALTYNRRLWTILATSVTSEDNPLPVEIRQNLGSLGAFILNHTLNLMMRPERDRIKTLISINRNIAQGLRGG